MGPHSAHRGAPRLPGQTSPLRAHAGVRPSTTQHTVCRDNSPAQAHTASSVEPCRQSSSGLPDATTLQAARQPQGHEDKLPGQGWPASFATARDRAASRAPRVCRVCGAHSASPSPAGGSGGERYLTLTDHFPQSPGHTDCPETSEFKLLWNLQPCKGCAVAKNRCGHMTWPCPWRGLGAAAQKAPVATRTADSSWMVHVPTTAHQGVTVVNTEGGWKSQAPSGGLGHMCGLWTPKSQQEAGVRVHR